MARLARLADRVCRAPLPSPAPRSRCANRVEAGAGRVLLGLEARAPAPYRAAQTRRESRSRSRPRRQSRCSSSVWSSGNAQLSRASLRIARPDGSYAICRRASVRDLRSNRTPGDRLPSNRDRAGYSRGLCLSRSRKAGSLGSVSETLRGVHVPDARTGENSRFKVWTR